MFVVVTVVVIVVLFCYLNYPNIKFPYVKGISVCVCVCVSLYNEEFLFCFSSMCSF
jgi:hypothetical protein